MSLQGYWFFALLWTRHSWSPTHFLPQLPNKELCKQRALGYPPSPLPPEAAAFSTLRLRGAGSRGPGQFRARAVPVLPVHGSSVQLLPFPVCTKWSAIGYPGTQGGAGVEMSPRPPRLVCQGPGLYFERSAIFTSSSPSQLSSFPRQPSPGRRRRRQSPPPSSSSRPGPPSGAAHTHISGETSRPPRQPSNAHRGVLALTRGSCQTYHPTRHTAPVRPAGTPRESWYLRDSKAMFVRRASPVESDTRTVKSQTFISRNILERNGSSCFTYISESLESFNVVTHQRWHSTPPTELLWQYDHFYIHAWLLRHHLNYWSCRRWSPLPLIFKNKVLNYFPLHLTLTFSAHEHHYVNLSLV